MHVLRTAGEQVVDVALAVHHRGNLGRRLQPLAGDLGAVQPAARLLLLGATLAVVRDLARGAVQHHAVDQADHTASDCVDRQHRVQEQADILAVAALAEAVLAGFVGGEMQFRRVLDRQHMSAGDPPSGLLARARQHLLRGHLWIGQEAAELQRLIAVSGQPMHAQGASLLHRPQHRHAHFRQPFVAKLPKPRPNHANRTLCQNQPGASIRNLSDSASHSVLVRLR